MDTIAELRVLVFSLSDIKKALEQNAENLKFVIPNKEITEIIGTGETEETEVTVLFKNSPGVHEPGIDVAATDMIESLISLCISRKIPIPRAAHKSIEVKPNNISMWIKSGDTGEVKDSENFEQDIN